MKWHIKKQEATRTSLPELNVYLFVVNNIEAAEFIDVNKTIATLLEKELPLSHSFCNKLSSWRTHSHALVFPYNVQMSIIYS